MTKRERAQVVELLRCAADQVDETCIPLTKAAQGLDCHPYESLIWQEAISARTAFNMETDYAFDTRTALLEAALRVEQGEWP